MKSKLQDFINELKNEYNNADISLEKMIISQQRHTYIKRAYPNIFTNLQDYVNAITPQNHSQILDKIKNQAYPVEFKDKILSLLDSELSNTENKISLFYLDSLNTLINSLQPDESFDTICQILIGQYTTLINEYTQLESIGYKFSMYFKTKFENSIYSINRIKDYASRPIQEAIARIKESQFETPVANILRKYLPNDLASYVTDMPIEYQYIHISNFPPNKEQEQNNYNARVLNEYSLKNPQLDSSIDSKFEINFEQDYIENNSEIDSNFYTNKADEEIIKVQELTRDEDIKEIEIKKSDINQCENKLKDNSDKLDFLKISNQIISEYKLYLDKSLSHFLDNLNSKRLTVYSEEAAQILKMLNSYEEPDLSEVINKSQNLVINHITQSTQASAQASSEFNREILKLFDNYAKNLKEGLTSIVSSQLNPEKISNTLLELSSINSEALVLRISNLETTLLEKVNSYLIKISENLALNSTENSKITDKVLSENSGLSNKINDSLSTAQRNIVESTREFSSKLDNFKEFMNDEVINKLSTFINNGSDLSRNLKITQSLLEKNHTNHNLSILSILMVLNLILCSVIFAYMYTKSDSGYKDDSIELHRIITNINKLDRTNRDAVAKALNIPATELN